MSSVIQALEEEVKAIEESIEKHKKKNVSEDILDGLKELREKVIRVLTDLKAGADLHMMCGRCKAVLPACDYGFSTIVQDCPDCGHHIKIEVTCPKCNDVRTVYRDRQFEETEHDRT